MKSKLVVLLALSSLCHVAVIGALCLFLTVPWVGMQCVIVVFSGHTYLLFYCALNWKPSAVCFFMHTTNTLIRPDMSRLISVFARGTTHSVFYCHLLALSLFLFEPWHDISYNVVYATSKASDQSAHMRSLIRGFASHLNIL